MSLDILTLYKVQRENCSQINGKWDNRKFGFGNNINFENLKI